MKNLALVGTAIALGLSTAASAQYVTFTQVTEGGAFNTRDMSPDGRFVVGDVGGGGGYLLDRKTGEMTILPEPCLTAVAVSDDGQFVAGDIPDPEGIGSNVAALWDAEKNSWTSLGALPNALGCPSRSDAYEISADGSVVVGLSWDGCSGRAFRWTQETGMVELQVLGSGGNRASVLSADGTLIGGFGQGSFSRSAGVWDGGSLAGNFLDPPNGDIVGEVLGMSDDGQTLLGVWDGKAFKWEEGQPIEEFSGPIAAWTGNAMDIADDGTIIGFDSFSTTRRAWIRPNGGPAEDLVGYLNGLGVPGVPPQLEVCHTLSANGNVMIGLTFFNPGWIIDLCTPDLNGNGAVDFADILEIIAAWGPCDGCAADLSGNGAADFADILVVIGAWGPCPY
ncbi:MAG: hypothetical protein ACYTGP_11975 [Planctomycetota bacterium]|jgi:probable HAF family extracellular repeat protein